MEHKAGRYLPLLVLLFIGSGCAALIYEIVWFQILELVIGSSSISLGILLGTFMGGMCFGSLVASRFIARTLHPLRIYAFLELGIALAGLLILIGLPVLSRVSYLATICLLPPTILMGATLPAISRWVRSTPEGISWLGFFYGGNIAGAVVGSLLTGFYLLRVYDIAIATFVAIAINIAVALLSLAIAKRTPYSTAEPDAEAADASPETKSVYLTIAVSGFTALAAEVLWTRILSLLFGATVYTFSLILSAFLFGLGIGSSLGSFLARKTSQPRLALGWCQLLLCVAMGWAAYSLLGSLPWWPINVTLSSDPWLKVQFDAARALWVVLPGAMLWGASFPLALASIASRGKDPGRLVGSVYAANTFGAIAGALLASLFLVSTFGIQHSLQALIALSAVAALLMLTESSQSQARLILTLLVAMVVTGVLLVTVPPLSGDFVAYGRFVPTMVGKSDVRYVGEGMMAFVAVSKENNGSLKYHNAGKVQASSDPADMRLQRMLGHLTTLIPSNPKNFFVLGFGSGATAGAVSLQPSLEHETVVEIEPLVPKFVATYFSEYNFDVTQNPKVKIEIDDGRHYLMTTDQKFDGITSDPLDPWVKGSAALYSKEFFETAKVHLNPGGVVTQWMPLYQTNVETVKSQIATFFEVFPAGSVFVNNIDGQGYDLVLLGQAETTRIDIDELAKRVEGPGYEAIANSLREIGFNSTSELLATFAGRAGDLRPWLAGAAINTDRNLRLQYVAGFGLNLFRGSEIYRGMVAYGPRMPREMFVGSEASVAALAKLIESGRFR